MKHTMTPFVIKKHILNILILIRLVMYFERILSDQFVFYFSSEIWQQWRQGPYHIDLIGQGSQTIKMIAASKSSIYTHL